MAPRSQAVAAPAAVSAAQVATTAAARPGLVAKFAANLGVESDKLLKTLKDTAFKQPSKGGNPGPEVTNEQMMALLVVADQYGLNPFTKEIYAFGGQGGGIVPMISFDGWVRIINERPELTSLTFEYAPDDSDDPWIECTIRRSDRSEPICIREYLSECKRNTDPWNQMPRRMLRHKALIQCARIAFGYGGVYDPDEGERIAAAIDITPGKPATVEPQATAPAAAQLTHVPVDELRRKVDQIGIPETEFCAHFEIGSIDELPLNQVQAARDYLDGLNKA